MPEDKSKKSSEKPKTLNINIKGIDIDRNEYQEIVLSNSNHPDNFKNSYSQNY